MQIEKNKVGLIQFTLKDTDGNLLDASGDTPLDYLHGYNNLIPKLEEELEGKEAGDKFSCTIQAADAYGEVNQSLIQAGIPKAAFQEVENIEVGMKFQVQSGDEMHVVTITEVTDEGVTVDANHELAGVDLVFEVEVTEVREATEEELEHKTTDIPQEGGCCSSGSGCCS